MVVRKPPVPESHVLGAIFTLLGLSFSFTVVRIWARRAMRTFGADDILIILGMAAAITMVALEVLKMRGIYRCIEDMEHHNYKFNVKSQVSNLSLLWRMAWVADFVYFAALAFVKCSILCFYKRLGPPHYHWILYLVMTILVLNSIVHIILNLVAITPVQAQWDLFIKKMPYTLHVKLEVIDLSFSCVQGLIDIIILSLPVPVLWSLHLQTGKKATLILIYLIGFVSFAATLVRIEQAVVFLNLKDPYQSFADNPGYTTWTQAEIQSAIICANIPAIYAAMKLFPWRRLRSKISVSRLTGWSTEKHGASLGHSSDEATSKSSTARTLQHAHPGDSDAHILRETDIYVTKEDKESYELADAV